MNTLHFWQLFLVAVMVLLQANLIKAQLGKAEFIEVFFGLGLSAPMDDIDIYSRGFSIQKEYIFSISKWFGLQPYARLILASSPQVEGTVLREFRTTTKAFLLGGKARICAPISYVAPYFEIGLGMSAGSFETFTPFETIDKNEILLVIPFSLGVALGRRNNYELGFA